MVRSGHGIIGSAPRECFSLKMLSTIIKRTPPWDGYIGVLHRWQRKSTLSFLYIFFPFYMQAFQHTHTEFVHHLSELFQIFRTRVKTRSQKFDCKLYLARITTGISKCQLMSRNRFDGYLISFSIFSKSKQVASRLI